MPDDDANGKKSALKTYFFLVSEIKNSKLSISDFVWILPCKIAIGFSLMKDTGVA